MRKIAIPLNDNNQIEDHFGQCEFYGIYTISDKNQVIETRSLKSEKGCGCKSDIANVLSQIGVSIMLAGGIGSGAINVLSSNNIQVLRGCSGKIEDIIERYINGQLVDSGESCLQHKHHKRNSQRNYCSQ